MFVYQRPFWNLAENKFRTFSPRWLMRISLATYLGDFGRTQGVNKFLGMRKIKSSLICIYHYIYIYIFIYLLINFYLTISLSRISLSLYLPICRSVFLSIYLPTHAALRFPRRNCQHAVPSVRWCLDPSNISAWRNLLDACNLWWLYPPGEISGKCTTLFISFYDN